MAISSEREMGASLVTVLMIVAAMSAVSVTITQSMTKAVSRAKVLDSQAQLRVSTAIAEAYGQFELSRLLSEHHGRLSIDAPGFYAPIVRSLDGGSMTLIFSDKTNCFNLNRLGVSVSDREIVAAQAEINTLIDVLVESGVDRYAAEIFAESSADWIDTDEQAMIRGAENNYYEAESSKVRTRGTWFQNQTEMNGVRGFTTEIRKVSKDLLCVHPRQHSESTFVPFNINTLSREQLPLLVVAYGGDVETGSFGDALRRRPIGGWQEIGQFIEDAALGELDPEFKARESLSVFSHFVQANITLQNEDMVAEYEVLYQIGFDTPIVTVQRRRAG